MGTTASTSCTNGKSVSLVKGLTSTNGKSPSEQWLITVDSKGKGVNTKTAFLKIFLSPSSNTNDLSNEKEFVDEDTKLERQALSYELRMYKYVINNILESGMSASFIHAPYILEGCTFKNLVETLKRSSSGQTDDEIGERLKRNLLLTYSGNANIRPSINSIGWDDHFQLMDSVAGDKAKGMKTLCRYDALGLESLTVYKTSYDLYNLCVIISKMHADELNENHRSFEIIKTSMRLMASEILFHVAAACYVMWTMGISHNDLHYDNIQIVILDYPELITYKYGENTYTCSSRIRVLIFDFDRGWCDLLGKNTNIEGSLCEHSHQCNYPQKNFDFFNVVSSIHNYLRLKGPIFTPEFQINRVLSRKVANDKLRSQMKANLLHRKYHTNLVSNDLREDLFDPDEVLEKAAMLWNWEWENLKRLEGVHPPKEYPPVVMDDIEHSKVFICNEDSSRKLIDKIKNEQAESNESLHLSNESLHLIHEPKIQKK